MPSCTDNVRAIPIVVIPWNLMSIPVLCTIVSTGIDVGRAFYTTEMFVPIPSRCLRQYYQLLTNEKLYPP